MTEVRHCHGHDNVKVYEVSGGTDGEILRQVAELVESTEDDLLSITGPSASDGLDVYYTVVLG